MIDRKYIHRYLELDEVKHYIVERKLIFKFSRKKTKYYKSKVRFYSSFLHSGHYDHVMTDEIYDKFPVSYEIYYETGEVKEFKSRGRKWYEDRKSIEERDRRFF